MAVRHGSQPIANPQPPISTIRPLTLAARSLAQHFSSSSSSHSSVIIHCLLSSATLSLFVLSLLSTTQRLYYSSTLEVLICFNC